MRILRWEVSVVTPLSFVDRYLKMFKATEWEQTYTLYLLELALVDYRMIKYKASHLAAAAVYLALKLSPERGIKFAKDGWVRRRSHPISWFFFG